MDEPGLRERKKKRTRDLITQTARRLFADRGFHGVTVAEIAAEAEVAEGTVFNYFGSKEDLFFAGMEAFENALIAAVRDRPVGQSVVDAFREPILSGAQHLASPGRTENAALGARLIAESPALQRKELEAIDGYKSALAQLLTEETSVDTSDIRPAVVANALMGVHRALVQLVRSLVIDGMSGSEMAARVAQEAEHGFSALSQGLGDYGKAGSAT